MKNSLHKKPTLAGTKDRSVEAYKVWIMEIASQLTTPGSEIKLTEKEWIENWKAFLKERPTR